MTALLLLAVAAAIACVAALIARRRRRPVYVGRHTGGYLLAEIAKAAERDDLMTHSQQIRCRVVAAQQAIKELTGKAVA
jgi:hypothetical protein